MTEDFENEIKEIIEKLRHGLVVCDATRTTLVHIEKHDAQMILSALKLMLREREPHELTKEEWGRMEIKPFRMKHNCLNCKHHEDDYICGKDGTDTSRHAFQESTCCELSELAKNGEELMNNLRLLCDKRA